MTSLGEQIANFYLARDYIVEQCGGPVMGTDLIEVLAGAMNGQLDSDMTVDEVRELVCNVQRQRQAEHKTRRDQD